MQSKKLDLVEICRVIYLKKWFVLIFAICAAVAGLIFCLLAQKQYTSTTVFIVKSPMNMDRNHIFRQGDYQPNDFFATENDIDNVLTLSNNEVLLQFLVDSFKLDQHYHVANKQIAYRILKRHFKVTRNDNRSLEFRISDPDPKTAADMVNTARWEVNNLFRNFFTQTKEQYITALHQNVNQIDGEIDKAEDTIQQLRQKYQLFNVLLPARGNALQPIAMNADAAKAAGMELLENATSKKDQLLKDKADNLSLINEYRLDTKGSQLDMFYTVQYGWPSDLPSFPIIPLILGICFVAGLFFSVIIVLLREGVKRINAEG